MSDFEGINPYEYQRKAVAYQKKQVVEQPHLKPQIEKAANLPPVEPIRREAPKPQGGRPTGGAETRGYGRAGAMGTGVEVGKTLADIGLAAGRELGHLAKETVKTIVKESIKPVTGRYEAKPHFRRKHQEPPPAKPRHEAGKIHAIRKELAGTQLKKTG